MHNLVQLKEFKYKLKIKKTNTGNQRSNYSITNSVEFFAHKVYRRFQQ